MRPENIAALAVPAAVLLTALLLLLSKKDLYRPFLDGIRRGGEVTVSVFPVFLLFSVAVAMLSASGLPAALARFIRPLSDRLGIPAEILPLAVLRPFSGSGANALLSDLFEKYGPDSPAGLCASVLMGSSDTLVYIICLYFSSVGIRRTRHAFLAAILVMLFSLFFSCALYRAFFGS